MPEREKIRHIGICMMAYYKTREICPKWSGTPSTAQDLSWTHHTELQYMLSLGLLLLYCSGFGQISRRQSAFAAQIKQTWSSLQSFPIISGFIEGNVSRALLDRNEGQIEAVPHLTDLIWLSIDSDLLLWPEIKMTAVFV